jgi:hypothetical protein
MAVEFDDPELTFDSLKDAAGFLVTLMTASDPATVDAKGSLLIKARRMNRYSFVIMIHNRQHIVIWVICCFYWGRSALISK